MSEKRIYGKNYLAEINVIPEENENLKLSGYAVVDLKEWEEVCRLLNFYAENDNSIAEREGYYNIIQHNYDGTLAKTNKEIHSSKP